MSFPISIMHNAVSISFVRLGKFPPVSGIADKNASLTVSQSLEFTLLQKKKSVDLDWEKSERTSSKKQQE